MILSNRQGDYAMKGRETVLEIAARCWQEGKSIDATMEECRQAHYYVSKTQILDEFVQWNDQLISQIDKEK